MLEERRQSRRFRIIPLICAVLAIALGLLTLIGWISGAPLLASVRANYIPMAPSTTFCAGESGSYIEVGAVTTQNVLLVTWEND